MTRKTLLPSLLISTGLVGGAVAQTEIGMLHHGAGNVVKSRPITRIVDDFNASSGLLTFED